MILSNSILMSDKKRTNILEVEEGMEGVEDTSIPTEVVVMEEEDIEMIIGIGKIEGIKENIVIEIDKEEDIKTEEIIEIHFGIEIEMIIKGEEDSLIIQTKRMNVEEEEDMDMVTVEVIEEEVINNKIVGVRVDKEEIMMIMEDGDKEEMRNMEIGVSGAEDKKEIVVMVQVLGDMGKRLTPGIGGAMWMKILSHIMVICIASPLARSKSSLDMTC